VNRIFAAILIALAISGPVGACLTASPADARVYADIVIDAVTGEVLRSRSPDTQIYPASLTKMMTLYLLFESLQNGRISLDATLTASAHAAGQPATNLALTRGQTLTVETAINALVVRSANDVAMVVAEALGGTEADFARRMTEKARALGMNSTTFRNPSGLPNSSQVSTARDMAILARALIMDFPGFYHYFSTTKFSYNGVTYKGHNRLMMSYQGADGLKTGYIRASGFNLAFSAVRDGRRLIGVVIGGQSAASRDQQMAAIMDAAFDRAGPVLMAAADPPPPKPDPDAPLLLASTGYDTASDGIATLIARGDASDGDEFGQGDLGGPGVSADTQGPIPLAGDWGIQVGAFSKQPAAQSAALYATMRVPQLLGGARTQIEEVTNELGTIYRARLVGIDEASAYDACRALQASDQPCIVLKGGSIVAANPN
jgi:D-alanyl-D-alanine carboxypeptidase